jgi:hypothetical protein
MIRLYLYAGLAALFLAMSITAYIQTKRVGTLKGKVAQLNNLVIAERENLKKANEASNAYQGDLKRLESERSNVPVVRLCKPARVSTPGAPSGSDAEAPGHVGEEAAFHPGPDIGDQLLEYAIAAEANMLQLERLQGWVRNR